MIGIIDVGTGNSKSISSAATKLNLKTLMCSNKKDLKKIKKLILPGVGAFGKFMENLHKSELFDEITKLVHDGMPILGICVGFQSLFSDCNEFGIHKGFNFINGNVKKMDKKNTEKIPHMGWNNCEIKSFDNLFKNLNNKLDFYFCHSYEASKVDEKLILSKTNYGHEIISSIKKDNIYGVQFHPEKSQQNGLTILKNFGEICR